MQPVSLDTFFMKHMLKSSDAQCQISNHEHFVTRTIGVADYRAEIGGIITYPSQLTTYTGV